MTSSTASHAGNFNTVTINGLGLNPTVACNRVTFNSGDIDTVTSGGATSLTVTFSTKPPTEGPLTATVRTNGVLSTVGVQVATVV